MYINRDKLKYRGRFRFRANYWHAVLVAFVYFLLNGGATVASRSYNTTTTTTNRSFYYNASYSLADDPSLQWIAGLAIGVLLFIIPGIIKSYSYRLVPYILAENPDIDTNEALMRSEQLMRGNKWETFIYDLSFIGWYILSIFTCGILSIFWVQPYKLACDAELYRLLAGKSGEDYSFGVEGTGTGPSGYEEPSYYAPGFGRNDSAATSDQASSSSPSHSSHSSETKSDGVVSEEDTIEYKPGE